jgi:membrane peptidoglycan carboxypeptidase
MNQNTGRSRRSRSTYTTKSGKAIKLNRSLSDRKQAKKAERAAEKALYLSTLPKGRMKRLLYRLEPKRLYHYWFSRQGALMGLKIVGVMVVLGFFLTIGMFAYFRKDLPQIKDIAGDNLGGSVSYYDSTGKVLLFQDYDGVKRVPVNSDQISPYMKEATVAIEDKDFYKEGAFDVRGILRAATHDAFGGSGSLQGGSTITQQLVKLNENWTNDRTITRKVKELILAVEVEREYTKDEILTGYLNIAPYGGVDYGVQSAAEDYFRTSAADLTLPEATMLAAIPQSPSYYSPYGSTQYNPAAGDTFSASALKTRQDYILQQMVVQNYITQAQATAAEGVNVLASVQPEQGKYTNIQDPYFVLAAKQQLQNQFGTTLINRGGLKVITTLNLSLQNYANQDVAGNERNVADVGGDEEAMVAEDVKTGQVVALVGGENFNDPVDGQINYANTNISPGSSFKPFLYAALIQNNTDVGAGSVLYDTQQPLPGYPCTNKAVPTATSNGGNCLFDDNFIYPGPETIRYALAGSRNVPAVKASYEVDPTDTSADNYTKSINLWIDTANEAIGTKGAYACYQQNANVETATAAQQTQCYGSAALGSGDTAIDKEVNGDATLARMGQEIPQTYILSVTDADNKPLYQWTQPKPTQVYKADTAYIVNDMLDDPRASYLTTAQKFQNYDGWDIAVKTGTENQEYNGVMTAWSTQYAVIGFAGYHTLDKPLEEGHFEDITEPITRTWMEQALTALHTKPVNWTQPSDIKTISGYVQRVTTGYGAEVPGPTTDVYPSWYTGKNSSAASESLDKVSGFLATSCTPSLAKETVGGANDGSFSIDIFYPTQVPDEQALEGGPAVKTSSSQTDNVHNCNDTPPSVTVTATNNNGSNTSGVCDTACTVTVAATAGTHPLSGGSYTAAPAGTISVSLGGNVINTVTIPSDQAQNFNDSFTYNPTSSGTGTLSATVVDSVLYESTGSTSLTYSAGLSGFTATPGAGGLDVFNWSGGTPTYTVSINGVPIKGCTAVNANTCTATVAVPSNMPVILEDSSADQVGPITSPRKAKKNLISR